MNSNSQIQNSQTQISKNENIMIWWMGSIKSPYPSRRRIDIDVMYPINSSNSSDDIKYDYLSPPSIALEEAIRLIDEFLMIVPISQWWNEDAKRFYAKCFYCKTRREMRKDYINSLNEWKEGYCLRHSAILFPSALNVISNNPRVFGYSDGKFIFSISSNKHEVTYYIYPSHAIAYFTVGNNSDKSYTFTYRNHSLGSSYVKLLNVIADKLIKLREILTGGIRCANVYVNNQLYVAVDDSAGYCP